MAGVQCRAELNTLCIDLDPPLPFGQFLFGTQMLSSFLCWRKWGLWLSVLSSWIAFNSSLQCTYSDLLDIKVLKTFLWFLVVSSLKVKYVSINRAFTLQSRYCDQTYQFLFSFHIRLIHCFLCWSNRNQGKSIWEGDGINCSYKDKALCFVLNLWFCGLC